MNHLLSKIAAPVFLLSLMAAPSVASAHGLHGHVHVTGWAIENLPPGELRDFFDDPEVFQAALAGAMFPDTGYALNQKFARTYAEHAHWEPFIEDFIQHVRMTYGPRYTKEERLVVAFLLGCASHGLQDELFDSTFLFESEQRDNAGQDLTDPGTDGFLVQDGHHRLVAGEFVPYDDMLPIFAELAPEITRQLITLHVTAVKVYTINEIGLEVALDNANKIRPQMPWGSTHYLDANVAGSLRAEILPTGRHMQALWDRLHDRFDDQDLLVHTWPEDTRRLREADHTSVGSWITFVLGKGIEPNTATASLVDANGQPHPFTLTYTRWGGTSRIVRLIPTTDFVPGGRYTATLDAGATLVDGSTTTTAQTLEFQVECASPSDSACPPLPEVPEPSIDSPIVPRAPSNGCVATTGAGNGGAAVVLLAAWLFVTGRRRTKRA